MTKIIEDGTSTVLPKATKCKNGVKTTLNSLKWTVALTVVCILLLTGYVSFTDYSIVTNLSFRSHFSSLETNQTKNTEFTFTYKGTKFKKQFAYYVQVEECLSPYLTESIALGNSSLMDVYILSYRRKCQGVNTPSHFTYLFNTKTTWSVGRNVLFFHVKDSGMKYYYHIFIDDDVEIFFTDTFLNFSAKHKLAEGTGQAVGAFLQKENYEKAIREIKNGMSPWRYYESVLMDFSPAYAVINLMQPGGESIRLYQKYHFDRICPPGSKMRAVMPSFFIDTRVIGYHHKALPLMLPYNVILEHVSWPISAVYTTYRAKAILHKQTITVWSLTSINRAHRPYPRNKFPDDYLEQYFQVEGSTIKEIIDVRDRDFVMFWDNGKWKDVFFNDKAVCTAPIKFPITDHYEIPEKFQRRP